MGQDPARQAIPAPTHLLKEPGVASSGPTKVQALVLNPCHLKVKPDNHPRAGHAPIRFDPQHHLRGFPSQEAGTQAQPSPKMGPAGQMHPFMPVKEKQLK